MTLFGAVQALLKLNALASRVLHALGGVSTRTEFVGFETADIAAGDTCIIACCPCIPLNVTHWVIPAAVAAQVTVDQITINGKDTLINCGSIPGAMLSEDSPTGGLVRSGTVQPGCTIQIQVTNVSPDKVVFRMGGLCKVLDR